MLVEVGGVGYLVTVTPRTLAELEPTSPAFLYVHHHIREDAQTLYGFLARDERATFDVLIATHGVGPALAMAILATHSPSALVDIVAGGDLAALDAGARRRQEDRRAPAGRAAQSGSTCRCSTRRRRRPAAASAVGDVREALAGLGYGPEEIREALRELPRVGDRADDLLRDALTAAGGPTCVTSSSIRRQPTTSRRPTRRGCARAG